MIKFIHFLFLNGDMKKEDKKFIKKIKQLEEGESISFYDYEILCVNHKSSFIIIHDMDMVEVDLDGLLDFIQM